MILLKILFSNSSRQSTLISHNGILTLCKIAIDLNSITGTQEGVLQIYHQKLCSPPSLLDKLIIEQFGKILISSSVSINFFNSFFDFEMRFSIENILAICLSRYIKYINFNSS